MGTPTRRRRARDQSTTEVGDDVVVAVRTLARVARLLERSCTPMTLAQYRVLTRIAAGEARASRISEQLLVAKPTVSAAIDALVAAGYLDRSADPDDRRAVGLAVTAAGVEALSTAEDAMAERLGPVLAGIADLGPFRDGCDAINAELDARFAARTSGSRVPTEAEGRP